MRKNSTVIIYTIKDAAACEFGRRASHVLSAAAIPADLSWTWVTIAEYELPEGYEVAERMDGMPTIYRGDECAILTGDKNDNPVILDISGTGYPAHIHLAKLRDLTREEA